MTEYSMQNAEQRKIFVVLLHHPIVDRHGKEVTTAVTNIDIHDIARSCATYGVSRYFIVNPEEEQRRIVKNILDHWNAEVSKVYHPSRAHALGGVQYCYTFEEAFNEAVRESNGKKPFVVMPDAKPLEDAWSYSELRKNIENQTLPGDQNANPCAPRIDLRPLMIVYGTGWGISPKFYPNVDRFLKPVGRAGSNYNHLSVRAAAAIVLDRIFGEH